MDLFLYHYFKFLSVIYPEGSKASKTQIIATRLAMWLNDFSLMLVFVFGYRTQNENPKIMENLYFRVYNANIHVDLFFDHYFYLLSE